MTDKVEYPEHLTEEIIKGALFVHNAPNKDEAQNRINFLVEELGYKTSTYIMALLMLPFLMDIVEKSEEYKEHMASRMASRKKTLN
jgi:hypothetical protein